MSRRAGRLAKVEQRLAVAEMRLRNLFAETAMMMLHQPGGCFMCKRYGLAEGHSSYCDFHSHRWNHPEDTVWNSGEWRLPDAPDDEPEPVCDIEPGNTMETLPREAVGVAQLDAQSPNEVRS